jgi:dynein heavy chain
MHTVLHMELGKMNRLMNKIRSTCTDLQKAVKGLVVFSSELESISQALLVNKIPAAWLGVSYPSLKPALSYFDDFLERFKFFDTWVKEDRPLVYWFSAFFFQQALLTGAMQNWCRAEKIAIDTAHWTMEVMKSNFEAQQPDKGIYINGLFLEGARWDDDTMTLAESHPKVLWETAPIIWLKPGEIVKDTTDYARCYDCPVYKESLRKGVLSTSGHSSNFIMYIWIPISPEYTASIWTKRGVAMISQTDD